MSLPLSILEKDTPNPPRPPRIAPSPFPSEYSLHRQASTISADSYVPELDPLPRRFPERVLRDPPSQEALHHTYSTYSKNAPSTQTANTVIQPDFEVDWENDRDPQNPLNWPVWYKALVIAAISWGTFCTVVYSTSYTSGIENFKEDFKVSSDPVVTLGLTTYRKTSFERERR